MARYHPKSSRRKSGADEKQQVSVLPQPKESQRTKRRTANLGQTPALITPGSIIKARGNSRGKHLVYSRVEIINDSGEIVRKTKLSPRQLAQAKARAAKKTAQTVSMLVTVDDGQFLKQRVGERLLFLNVIANEKFANPDLYEDDNKQLFEAFHGLNSRQRSIVLSKLKDKYQGF